MGKIGKHALPRKNARWEAITNGNKMDFMNWIRLIFLGFTFDYDGPKMAYKIACKKMNRCAYLVFRDYFLLLLLVPGSSLLLSWLGYPVEVPEAAVSFVTINVILIMVRGIVQLRLIP